MIVIISCLMIVGAAVGIYVIYKIEQSVLQWYNVFLYYKIIVDTYIYKSKSDLWEHYMNLRKHESDTITTMAKMKLEVYRRNQDIVEYKSIIKGKEADIKNLTHDNDLLKQKTKEQSMYIDNLQNKYDESEYARIQLLEIKEDIRVIISRYNDMFRDNIKQPTNDDDVKEFNETLICLIDHLVDKIPDDIKQMSQYEWVHLQTMKNIDIWESISENMSKS